MIEIRQLSLHYQGLPRPALDKVNLTINDGSLFGLLGPNGAGKTSLLSILSGHIKSYSGEASINGIPLRGRGNDWKSLVSLVPQEYAFYNKLRVAENLTLFAKASGIRKRDCSDAIARVTEITSLQDHLNSLSGALSGGLKRRLNLAIGLLNQPSVIMLDEPTVGIDPHSRHFILETLAQLNRDGTTIIYTSHYMEEVESLCKDIAILDDGRILLQGSKQQLLGESEHRHLHIELDKPLTAKQSHTLRLSSHTNENIRKITVDEMDPNKVVIFLEQLRKLGISYRRLHYGSRNLEDVFLNITQPALRDEGIDA